LRSEAERLDDPDSPEPARELLIALALSRGFMVSTKGGPDESRAARILLKDLVNAKLLHCSTPPDVQGQGAAGMERAKGRARKEPAAPTAERWLTKLRKDYEAQGGREGHFAGRRGAGTQGAPRGVQIHRPHGSVPDRLVARGTKGIQFAPSE
jgi:large subunit GTPase 1